MGRLAVVFGALALAGCATGYHEMDAFGGVRAVRISEDSAQITASGNAYTDPDKVQQYALRRAAQETIDDGYDLFRIVDAADRTTAGIVSFSSASIYRRSAFGTAFAAPVIKPGQSLLIKMLHGPAPDPLPDNEFDAHQVLRYLAESDASADHRDCTTVDGKVVCK